MRIPDILGRSVPGNKKVCIVFCLSFILIHVTCHVLCYVFSTMEHQCYSRTTQRLLITLLWTNMNSTPCDVTLYESGTTVPPGRATSNAPPLHHDAICITVITMKYRLLSTEVTGGSRSSLTIYRSKLWNWELEYTCTNCVSGYWLYFKIKHDSHL